MSAIGITGFKTVSLGRKRPRMCVIDHIREGIIQSIREIMAL